MTQYKTYQKTNVPFDLLVSGGSIPGWSGFNGFGRNPTSADDTLAQADNTDVSAGFDLYLKDTD